MTILEQLAAMPENEPKKQNRNARFRRLRQQAFFNAERKFCI